LFCLWLKKTAHVNTIIYTKCNSFIRPTCMHKKANSTTTKNNNIKQTNKQPRSMSTVSLIVSWLFKTSTDEFLRSFSWTIVVSMERCGGYCTHISITILCKLIQSCIYCHDKLYPAFDYTHVYVEPEARICLLHAYQFSISYLHCKQYLAKTMCASIINNWL